MPLGIPPRLPSSYYEDSRISVIVPVRNEAAIIHDFIKHVISRIGETELLIVDGDSTDETVHRAARIARVLQASPGRARQMNAGAAATSGSVLWFLHADSWLPERPLDLIQAAMEDPSTAGGCFRLRIPHPHPVYRLNDRLGNLGVDWLGIACGDHGLFIRRSVFERLGGYPDVPILEDVELYRRARRQGRMRQLRAVIETSPRRWERNGVGKTTAVYGLILTLHALGVPIPRLYKLYRRLR
jgi:rSAM/selenodomain-associated transferase 2